MINKLLTAAGLGLLAAATAWAQGRTFVTYEPASTVSVRAGYNAPASFVFHVASGYHINSSQPTAPELIPTQIFFSLPGEIAVGKVQYPPGQYVSFPFDPTQKLSVYSGDVTIHALVIAPKGASPGAYTIHGELKYQACDNNACYPPKKLPFVFDVRVTADARKSTHPRESPRSLHIRN